MHMTTTPIFDALCREHPNVGTGYHEPSDGSRKHELSRLDRAGRAAGSSRSTRQARRAASGTGRHS